MATRAEILAASQQAADAEIRIFRKQASPWPDVAMGTANGAGYGFSDDRLLDFISAVFSDLKKTPLLKATGASIRRPSYKDIPLPTLLAGTKSACARWIGAVISDELGVP